MEDIIGALILFITWCSGQADHQRIEIVKKCTIFIEHTAVSFINDDQVEAPDAEFPRIIVDQVDHGLIGREDNAGIRITIHASARIDAGGNARQQFSEVLVCLVNQACAVSQKQNVLCPVCPQQHIRKSNGYACLTRSGCHDQEAGTPHTHECFAASINCFLLVVPSSDIVVNLRSGDILTDVSTQLQQFQLLNGMKLEDSARRISQLVDDKDIIAVCVICNWFITIFHSQLVCLIDGLCAPLHRAPAGGRILDDGKRFPILAVHHIINILARIQMNQTSDGSRQGLVWY